MSLIMKLKLISLDEQRSYLTYFIFYFLLKMQKEINSISTTMIKKVLQYYRQPLWRDKRTIVKRLTLFKNSQTICKSEIDLIKQHI